MNTLSALSPDLLTNEEAAALLGIKPNTLEIWRTKGKGPEFVKLGRTKSAPIRYVLHESAPFTCIDLDVKDDTSTAQSSGDGIEPQPQPTQATRPLRRVLF